MAALPASFSDWSTCSQSQADLWTRSASAHCTASPLQVKAPQAPPQPDLTHMVASGFSLQKDSCPFSSFFWLTTLPLPSLVVVVVVHTLCVHLVSASVVVVVLPVLPAPDAPEPGALAEVEGPLIVVSLQATHIDAPFTLPGHRFAPHGMGASDTLLSPVLTPVVSEALPPQNWPVAT